MFGNWAVPENKYLRSFFHLYPKHDVPILSAVSNSAAFPWVSPAARAEGHAGGIHFIDGGYFDNFGVATALEFVANNPTPVLIIQIEASPEGEYTSLGAEDLGWFDQLGVPPAGLIHTWQIGARARNHAALETMPGHLKRVCFTYQNQAKDYPTSWHLTNSQTDSIRDYWNTSAAQCVSEFLAGKSQPTGCGCQ